MPGLEVSGPAPRSSRSGGDHRCPEKMQDAGSRGALRHAQQKFDGWTRKEGGERVVHLGKWALGLAFKKLSSRSPGWRQSVKQTLKEDGQDSPVHIERQGTRLEETAALCSPVSLLATSPDD